MCDFSKDVNFVADCPSGVGAPDADLCIDGALYERISEFLGTRIGAGFS